MAQYTKEELKAFEEKDLRVCRQNGLRHATSIMTSVAAYINTANDKEKYMEELFSIASSCVAFVYEGMKFPGEQTESKPDLKITPEQSEVLTAIADEAGIPTEMLDSLAEEIIRVFGKLPTNMKSVSKVINSIDLERIS